MKRQQCHGFSITNSQEEMRDTNESTNSRVLYFSLFSMCCLLGLATWQVNYFLVESSWNALLLSGSLPQKVLQVEEVDRIRISACEEDCRIVIAVNESLTTFFWAQVIVVEGTYSFWLVSNQVLTYLWFLTVFLAQEDSNQVNQQEMFWNSSQLYLIPSPNVELLSAHSRVFLCYWV